MSEYYEIEKPFSRENWNKLIQDINDMIEDPPGDCPPLEPLEEAEENHIWTKKDVEDVRDKLEEMCPNNEFEEDLDKPWNTAIIDELEDNMKFCDCGIDEYSLDTKYIEIGTCYQNRIMCENMRYNLATLIDGMFVGKRNWKWYGWQTLVIHHSNDNDTEFAEKKAEYDSTREPGAPPFEAVNATCCGQTPLGGGFIWCDGIIHTTNAGLTSECEAAYINYPCINNPYDSEIIAAANEAYLQAAMEQVAELNGDGHWYEIILRIFSHQAVPCVEGDPYFEEEES